MYDMTTWTPAVSEMRIVTTGFIQGAGLGFLFVPLTVSTFSTLPAATRGEATGLYNLSRNIGSSVGISVVSALLTENIQVNHADIASYITPYNRMLHVGAAAHLLDPMTRAGRAALDSLINAQAVVIGYIDDFKLLMIMSLVVMPLVFLLRKPGQPVAMDHSAVME